MDNFLGIGFFEILFILVIALALVGPRKLPEIAAKMGRVYRRLKMASQDLTAELTREVGEVDMKIENPIRKAASEINSELSGVRTELIKKVESEKPSEEAAKDKAEGSEGQN